MEKTTKNEVLGCFFRLANALGKTVYVNEKDYKKYCDIKYCLKPTRVTRDFQEVSSWRLCYASIYGGYVIEEVDNELGGISHPLSSRRRKARQFCEAVWFACDALYLQRQRQERLNKYEIA